MASIHAIPTSKAVINQSDGRTTGPNRMFAEAVNDCLARNSRIMSPWLLVGSQCRWVKSLSEVLHANRSILTRGRFVRTATARCIQPTLSQFVEIQRFQAINHRRGTPKSSGDFFLEHARIQHPDSSLSCLVKRGMVILDFRVKKSIDQMLDFCLGT